MEILIPASNCAAAMLALRLLSLQILPVRRGERNLYPSFRQNTEIKALCRLNKLRPLEELSGVMSEHEGTGLPCIPAADAARLHPGGSELSCRLPAELQVGDVLLRGLLSESLDGRTFEAAGHCPTTVVVRGAWCPRDRLVRADSGCLQLETKQEESCWIIFWQWREN